jgi:hypothetical protein
MHHTAPHRTTLWTRTWTRTSALQRRGRPRCGCTRRDFVQADAETRTPALRMHPPGLCPGGRRDADICTRFADAETRMDGSKSNRLFLTKKDVRVAVSSAGTKSSASTSTKWCGVVHSTMSSAGTLSRRCGAFDYVEVLRRDKVLRIHVHEVVWCIRLCRSGAGAEKWTGLHPPGRPLRGVPAVRCIRRCHPRSQDFVLRLDVRFAVSWRCGAVKKFYSIIA